MEKGKGGARVEKGGAGWRREEEWSGGEGKGRGQGGEGKGSGQVDKKKGKGRARRRRKREWSGGEGKGGARCRREGRARWRTERERRVEKGGGGRTFTREEEVDRGGSGGANSLSYQTAHKSSNSPEMVFMPLLIQVEMIFTPCEKATHLRTQSHSNVPDSMVTTHRDNDVGTGAVVAERGELVSGIAGHDCKAGKGGHQKEQVSHCS